METDGKTYDRPNIFPVAPPFIYLFGLILGVMLQVFLGILFSENIAIQLIGFMLIIGGVAMIYMAVKEFRQMNTNVSPVMPSSNLVTTGIYKFTRNPIYTGFILVYLGISLIFSLIWSIILLPFVILFIQIGVVTPEEQYLEKKFGENYINYKNKVRRWI